MNRTYDEPTRNALRGNLDDFGNTLAGRGPSLNITIERLPRFLRLAEPVARNLADPQTRIGRFFRELGDTARVVAPIADTQSDVFTRAALTFEAISSDTEALKQTIERSHPAFQAGIDSFPVQRPFLVDSAALARETQPVARLLGPTLPLINEALETGTPVTRRSVDFYRDLRPALVSLRELMEDPATGVALRGLRTTVRSLQPQLRFLGPYQTVCNYWNYFFTFLGEHVSQNVGPFGYSQRNEIKSTGVQSNNPSSIGAAEPGNGEGYQEGSRSRGSPANLHAQAYSKAIGPDGSADCENGQRGYMRRLARFSAATSSTGAPLNIVTDNATPGLSGPTYRGRARVPGGQSFVDRPETGAHDRAMRAPDIERIHGRGMERFRAGLLALVVIAIATYFAFSKELPFRSPYELSAVFHSAVNVKERQPVRIAGVDVGEVVAVEHPEPGQRAGADPDGDRRRGPADPPRRAPADPAAAVPGGQLVPRARARDARRRRGRQRRRDSDPADEHAGPAGTGAHGTSVRHAQEPADAPARVLACGRARGR